MVLARSRADPQLRLARLRARGQLAELRRRGADVHRGRSGSLCAAEAAGLELRDDEMAPLVARTEGWATGLQLAALSLHRQPDVAAFVKSFSAATATSWTT